MGKKIGENINRLRKQLNFTQQQLSNILGVSVAAISKWETGAAYPDIELLPKLASIFHVSIDYIFDFNLDLTGKRTEIIENARYLFQLGQHSEAISILSEALLRYPNDELIRFNRAKLLVMHVANNQSEPEKTRTYLEVNKELEEVIGSTDERDIIDECNYLLGMSYVNLKDFNKALEVITKIHQSPHINTGVALLRIHLDQGDIDGAIKQFEINVFLALANIQANTVWVDQLFEEELEKAISFYEMAAGAFSAYTDNRPCRFDGYISTFYERAALACARTGRPDKALSSLKLACQYACTYDNLQEANDLPQFDRLSDKDTEWGVIRNQKMRLLNTIKTNIEFGYKELCTMNEFIEVISLLKNDFGN